MTRARIRALRAAAEVRLKFVEHARSCLALAGIGTCTASHVGDEPLMYDPATILALCDIAEAAAPVVEFVREWWPGLEGGISWDIDDDDRNPVYQAALRADAALARLEEV